ncbi:hypothetical protein LCGC14_1412950 [marine sediment metagenome]|uniref:Lipoprotein n=1 Tax=marine sediment metagenome TaxID=412755 RepID=A0A0F9M920_9ZZZZ
MKQIFLLMAVALIGCGDATGPEVDPCAAIPWQIDEATGIRYKICLERRLVRKELLPLPTAGQSQK